MSIQILSDAVASQIAAGEVVERPASVVKELLENSLDAGAKQVTIRIEQGGRRVVEVTDDGAGIPANELALAVARHATSKLCNAEDLFRIQTLGFRGEALASIASVSRFTLISRVSSAAAGAKLRVDGGQVGLTEATGAPVGTQIRVEDLFYNVPARLKFLKQDYTERQHIEALVTRYALAYPQISVHQYNDGQPVLRTTGNGNRREVLANLYGVDIARQMLEVTFQDDLLTIEGFISPVALTRSNRKEITFFVNGRWVQDSSLSAAMLQAYHTLLMVGRFPMAVLFIRLPPEEVDVNVHPAKAEVRFRSPDRVFSGVQRAVRRALLAYSPIPQAAPPSWGQPESRTIDPAWQMSAELKAGAPVEQGGSDIPPPFSPSGLPMGTAQAGLPGGNLPLLRLLGQLGATYLIAEGPDGLYLIDQHAAHERVLFERFTRQDPGAIPGQALLQPVVIHLSAADARLLEEQRDTLNRLGFQIEVFGPESFRVLAVPAFLAGADPAAMVRVVVEDFEEDETPLKSVLEQRLIARICKRSAVKGGQLLSQEEQRILLRDLEQCVSPRTCPHGRPTMIHLSVDLLERQFGRKGSR
ncbi:MAG TPA: DNA mismatch repair endonuclease MutL [Anaerolineaceae bacterium]